MPTYTGRRRPVYRSSNHTTRRQTGGKRRGQYIDPSKFVKRAQPSATEIYEPQHRFEDFAIEKLIKQNLENKGFTSPTPIQDQAIPAVLAGRDVIGIASTGTGKTAAFAVPLIHQIMTDSTQKALIIAPTRELAQQIEEQCRIIGKGSGLRGALLIGGSPMPPQLRSLKQNPNVVIGTPGRIMDHMQRGTLNLGTFNNVVLDEVDRMLDMGFIADVTNILEALAPKRQSLFFSATMEPKVRRLIETFSHDAVSIALKASATSDSVNQDVVQFSGNSDKMEKLHDILLHDQTVKTIIFDETQRNVERLAGELIARGFAADAIHGGKSQSQRERALRKFKKNDVNILVATDVAARGIDVADITHVINYTQPQSYEDYVHRVGRAGRAGKIGHAFTFVGR